MQNSILDLIGIDVAYILIGMFVLIIILLVLILVNKSKLKKIEEKYERFMRGSDGVNLEATIFEKFDDIDELKEENENNTKMIASIEEKLQKTYQKTGIVKYNAFKEMGGNLSSVVVLLDNDNTGIMLDIMHSREGCYTYVREIIKGESYVELSEEEKEALGQAINQNKII